MHVRRELAEARIAAWIDGGKIRPKTLRVYASLPAQPRHPGTGAVAPCSTITAEDVMAVVEPILKRTHQTGTAGALAHRGRVRVCQGGGRHTGIRP